jgi:pimeloyl-ACP methyl ester carboxylesterase
MPTCAEIKTSVASRDGTEIAYWTSGDGPPLVLAHGAPADHTRWRPLLPYLEQHVTVHAIDRRGRGASGDAPEYSLEREHEDVAAVVDAVAASGEQVDVYGHSHGGIVAFGAATLTGNIRRLVLYEGWPVPDPSIYALPADVVRRMDKLFAEGDRDGVVEALFRSVEEMSAEDLAALRSAPSWPGRVAAAHNSDARDPRRDPGPTRCRAGSEVQRARPAADRREKHRPRKARIWRGRSRTSGRRGCWCWRDSSTSPTSWTLRTSRSTCWSSRTARRRAPVDCLVRPLVTGWVAQSAIEVGAFMISSALATRDELFWLTVLHRYRRQTEPMGALPAQRTRSRGRSPHPGPIAGLELTHQPRERGGASASDLPSVRKAVPLRHCSAVVLQETNQRR